MTPPKWMYDPRSESVSCTQNGREFTIYREGEAFEVHVLLESECRYATVGPFAESELRSLFDPALILSKIVSVC